METLDDFLISVLQEIPAYYRRRWFQLDGTTSHKFSKFLPRVCEIFLVSLYPGELTYISTYAALVQVLWIFSYGNISNRNWKLIIRHPWRSWEKIFVKKVERNYLLRNDKVYMPCSHGKFCWSFNCVPRVWWCTFR